MRSISHRARVSRRQLIRTIVGGAATLGSGAAPAVMAAAGAAPESSDSGRDLTLVNGRILTLDEKNTVASAVAIRDGRIAEVGSRVKTAGRILDLKGATVIPGLIDTLLHLMRAASTPGHHVQTIETAASIPELQQMIQAVARTASPGEFITSIGGWNRAAFAEKRMPTVAELDAAAPRNPVYLAESEGLEGVFQSVSNSAAIAFFQSKGVEIDRQTGIRPVISFPPPDPALGAMQSLHTEAHERRNTLALTEYAASLGLTMVTVNSYDAESLEQSLRFLLELWRRQALKLRVRVRYSTSTIEQLQERLRNSINRFGDDLLRLNGCGEGLPGGGGWPPGPTPEFTDAVKIVAAHGWSANHHSIFLKEITGHVEAFEAANAQHPIKDLRWSLCHVNEITPALAQRMIDIGAGAEGEGWIYSMPSTGSPSGPPYRMLLDKGMRLGAGTDGTRASHMNPWLTIYYMVTGRNSGGELVNPGQQVSRLEALKIHTQGSAWHAFDDDKLGTIEPGKLADLAVLSDDPLTVPDDRLRRITSTLTLQAGKIVHGPST